MQAFEKSERLLFLTGVVNGDIDTLPLIQEGKHNAASYKIQVKPLIDTSRTIGLTPAAINLYQYADHPYSITTPGEIAGCVICKLAHINQLVQSRYNISAISLIARLKLKRVPIITLYSDNLCAKEGHLASDLYKEILGFTDHLVTATESMGKACKQYVNPNCQHTIIEDPCLVRPQDFPSLNEEDTIRIIWFGNPVNFTYLSRIIEPLLANIRQCKCELTIFTSFEHLDIQSSLSQWSHSNRGNWSFRCVSWASLSQPLQLEQELGRAHIALLPSDPMDPLKVHASHNRLVDAIQSGCVTVASSIPSYQELCKISIIGNDVVGNLAKAIDQYRRLANKYSSLRSKYLERFNPTVNRKKWKISLEQSTGLNGFKSPRN